VLPFLRSNAAVKVMVENLGKVAPATSQEWLVAIGFIPHPDLDTLETVLKLLPLSKNHPQVFILRC